jgi:hypothetical protein
MRKTEYHSLYWRLLMLFCSFLAACPRGTGQETPNESWVQENYASALEIIFHDVCTPFISGKAARWTACIRIAPAFRHERESIFYLEKSYTGTIEARASIPKDRSIYDQLSSLRRDNPNASLSDLCKLVHVGLVTGDQSKLPRLTTLSSQFDKLQIPVALSDELTSDPNKYSLHIKSYTGNELDVILYGKETNVSKESDPLLQWELAVKAVLTMDER